MYDPWADLAERYPLVTVETVELDDGVMGEWDGTTLRLDSRLTPGEQRATLTHEIVHLDRGLPQENLADSEEEVVEDVSSRMLVALDDLAVAVGELLRSSLGTIAQTLECDTLAVATRISHLTPAESAQIARIACDQVLPAADNVVSFRAAV